MTATPAPDPAWAAVRALFERAAELPPGAREALLADAVHDPAVVAEVRSLLAHAGGAAGDTAFLSTPAAAAAEPGREGQRLGAWRIGAPLGRGGMGEVWAAERADGRYQGRAAIKVLKRGMDSDEVLARFAQEQQALARLSHPNIAHLIDAGLTPDGVPYFVMERVDGRPIDAACAGLPLADRLRLFLQLADAVAHAHRNLLVHRDLKPGNVLVTAEGQVKLLDFGIAKALEPGPEGATTQHGQRPFTPHYASPEQVRGEPVSTATDLYSLGVLLYVMLTGERPYGRQATSPLDAARAVLEEEPTRPSSVTRPDPGWESARRRLRGDLDNILLKALEKPVERRYPSVDAFAADIRAYLDGFPVSARPASLGYVAGKFVRRHRWAVLAGGLGGVGLATGLAAALLHERVAAALGVVGLAGGLGLALLQAQAASRARDAAAAARDEAQRQLADIKRITTDLVFRYGDTVTTLPGGAAAQEPMLQQVLASLEPALRARPDDSELAATMAAALGRLAEIQGNTTLAAPQRVADAEATVARALALGQRAWPQRLGDHRFASWHIRTLVVQAQLQRGAGRLEDAVATLQQAARQGAESLQALTAGAGDAVGRAFMAVGVANAHLTLAQLYDHANLPSLQRPDEALAEYRLAEAGLRAVLAQTALLEALDGDAAPGDPSSASYLNHQIGVVLGGRALVHLRREDLPAMRTEAEAAMVMHRRAVDAEPSNVAWRDGLMTEANTLALALVRLGEMPAALQASQLAWDTAAALARDEGPQSKWAGVQPLLAAQHARALAGNGRHEEAAALHQLAVEHWQRVLDGAPNAPAGRRHAWHQVQRARSLAALGRPDATALARSAVAALEGLADEPVVARDALLARAEGEALLATLEPDAAAAHRDAAVAALQAARELKPLGADHARLLVELRAPA